MTKRLFIGTKVIEAEPMTREEFRDKHNRVTGSDEDLTAEGYAVTYENNYISWSPKAVFEESYNDLKRGVDIGQAVLLLKAGFRMQRKGWNGKGMFLYYVPADEYPAQTDVAKESFGDKVAYGAYVAMRTADGTVIPWLASQTDLLAKDWTVVA